MNINILITTFDHFYNKYKNNIILSNRLNDLPETENNFLQNEFSHFLKYNSNSDNPAKTFYDLTQFGNNFYNQSYSPYSQLNSVADNLYFDVFEYFFVDIIRFAFIK